MRKFHFSHYMPQGNYISYNLMYNFMFANKVLFHETIFLKLILCRECFL